MRLKGWRWSGWDDDDDGAAVSSVQVVRRCCALPKRPRGRDAVLTPVGEILSDVDGAGCESLLSVMGSCVTIGFRTCG